MKKAEPERNVKAIKYLRTATKVAKVLGYILALGLIGYGAFLLTLPNGMILGSGMILGGLLVGLFTHIELKVRE